MYGMVRIKSDKIKLDVIAAELERCKRIDPSGIVFTGGDMTDLAAILQTASEFSERIPDTERQRIINVAVFEAAKTGPLTRKSLLEAMGRLESEYLSSVRRTMVVATTVSLAYGPHLRRVQIDDAVITFSHWLPPRFDRAPLKAVPGWPESPDPFTHVSIRVAVRARSKYEAIDRGMDALDLLRGMWNYSLTRLTISRHSSGPPQPINVVRGGPFHSLHFSNGALVDPELFWYQRHYDPCRAADPRREWKRVREEEGVIRRVIKRIPYGGLLRDIFIRYARAFDSSDFDSVFLRLWSLLELLTDTVGGRYDQTIRRTLFTYVERDLNGVVLENLRNHRNAVVHHGVSADQIEILTYQLKRYVDDLIQFHIQSAGKYATLAAVGEFLDLPFEKATLVTQIRKYRDALKYRAG
jgi:hypothetical protein